MTDHGWAPQRYRATALSTRPFRLADDDVDTRITREALDGILEQVRTLFVPNTVEHLTFLPPIGRWNDGTIVIADDGEAELILEGIELAQMVPMGQDPQPLALVDKLPSAAPATLRLEAHYEPRNFAPDAAKQLRETCPIPLKEEHRWSALPPLEWILAIPVAWGAVRFAGAFFDEMGHAAAKGFLKWVGGASDQARSADRDRLLTVQFELGDNRYVYAIIPFPDGTSTDELSSALDSIGEIAAFAGLLPEEGHPYNGWFRGAFIFHNDAWHFAWWTNGERVYRTHWFDEHCPDPARFLGRPLFSEEVGVAAEPHDPR